ncbi:hypothetical protein FHG87_009165 [Trinorchestia longiramus]|nr:hypothetical protein FHG87_009165 [Trinorchestia longiramus]
MRQRAGTGTEEFRHQEWTRKASFSLSFAMDFPLASIQALGRPGVVLGTVVTLTAEAPLNAEVLLNAGVPLNAEVPLNADPMPQFKLNDGHTQTDHRGSGPRTRVFSYHKQVRSPVNQAGEAEQKLGVQVGPKSEPRERHGQQRCTAAKQQNSHGSDRASHKNTDKMYGKKATIKLSSHHLRAFTSLSHFNIWLGWGNITLDLRQRAASNTGSTTASNTGSTTASNTGSTTASNTGSTTASNTGSTIASSSSAESMTTSSSSAESMTTSSSVGSMTASSNSNAEYGREQQQQRWVYGKQPPAALGFIKEIIRSFADTVRFLE